MSLKRPLPSDFSSTEVEEIILPEEVLIQIWTYLDFKMVQKTCTRVSKSWFEMIRNSKLSWEMKLRNTFYYPDWYLVDMLEVEDFNAMLFHWKNLRVLHFSSEPDFTKFRLCLDSHKSLEKVVISSGPALSTKGTLPPAKYWGSYLDGKGLWGWVIEYWIDPSQLLTPTVTIKNVTKLKMDLRNLPEEFPMKHDDCDLTNLETLEIYRDIIPPSPYEHVVPNTEMIFRFKNLKKLIFCVEIDINYLQHVLRFLGNTEDVKLFVNIEVTIYDKVLEEVKAIFDEGERIIREKFPFHDTTRILELKINCNHDSTDGNVENSDSLDESVESSNSMDGTVENSDSPDERDENSDVEDVNVLE